jgi:hypothetical protein
MSSYEKVLQAALGSATTTVPADTIVKLSAKGLNLKGTIGIDVKGEVHEDEIVRDALSSAVRRIEDIIEGVMSQDMLASRTLDKVTKVDKKGKVNIPTKLAGLQGSDGKFISALNLTRILNLTLFQHVKNLMGEPGLVNRTGRFANSAHITALQANKDQTKSRGSIYFSYMLVPYAVFAGHKDRDPATLIREAISIALAKALTPSSFKTANFTIEEG